MIRPRICEFFKQPCTDKQARPFRFLDLPSELQLHVLEYTDLIAPFREVESGQKGTLFLRCNYCCICRTEGSACPACQYPFDHNNHDICSRHDCPSSPRCGCWGFPASLFLVSHRVQELAQEIFYKRNRFVITPPGWLLRHQYRQLCQFPMAIFLSKVVSPHAIQSLGQIDIALPTFEDNYLYPFETAWTEWQQGVDLMKAKMCLPKLTLRIYISYFGLAMKSEVMSRLQMDFLLTQYKKFLKTLSQLKGLQRFFVHVVDQLPWVSRRSQLDAIWNREMAEERARLIECDIEQFVMGDDYVNGDLKYVEYHKPRSMHATWW